jgi:hypothetical protein
MIAADSEMLYVTRPLFDGLYAFEQRALVLGRDPS